jgi:hypothetical protein
MSGNAYIETVSTDARENNCGENCVSDVIQSFWSESCVVGRGCLTTCLLESRKIWSQSNGFVTVPILIMSIWSVRVFGAQLSKISRQRCHRS